LVGETDSPEELGDFTGYRGAARGRVALPSPIQPESLSMPTDDGFRPDDQQCRSPFRRQACQPDREGTVRATEAELMATAGALQDQERMTQGQDFSFEN
jgi:hypothetical protein